MYSRTHEGFLLDRGLIFFYRQGNAASSGSAGLPGRPFVTGVGDSRRDSAIEHSIEKVPLPHALRPAHSKVRCQRCARLLSRVCLRWWPAGLSRALKKRLPPGCLPWARMLPVRCEARCQRRRQRQPAGRIAGATAVAGSCRAVPRATNARNVMATALRRRACSCGGQCQTVPWWRGPARLNPLALKRVTRSPPVFPCQHDRDIREHGRERLHHRICRRYGRACRQSHRLRSIASKRGALGHAVEYIERGRSWARRGHVSQPHGCSGCHA